MPSDSSSRTQIAPLGDERQDFGDEELVGEGTTPEGHPDLNGDFGELLDEPEAEAAPPPPPPTPTPTANVRPASSAPRATRPATTARGRPRRPTYEDETTRRQLEFFRSLPPAQKWWLRRVGPKARGDGTEVQCGIYPQPVHGALTVEAIFHRIGGGSVQVCAGDDPHVADAEWLGPVEILGEPRVDIDLDASRKRAAAQSAPSPPPHRPSEDDADRLVEVYDAERGLFVKVPRSHAQAFGRPTKPATDPALAALLAEMREANRQNADAIKALAERVATPAPAAPAPPGNDLLLKELFGLLKSERAAAREAPPAAAPAGLNAAELLRYALDALKPAAQPKPLEGINSVLELAERLADMRSGRTSEDRFDKVFNSVTGGLGRFYSTAESPLMKLLNRVADALPVAPQPAAGTQQIEHTPAPEGAAAATASAPESAPANQTPPASAARPSTPTPQGLALLGLVQRAADGFCDMLDGKVAPEAFWQELSANAPSQILEQVREVDSAGAIEAALVKMAKHPVLATRAARLREVARRATGDGRAIAERFVELIQGGASPQGGATP